MLELLYKKALNLEYLSIEEGIYLSKNAPTAELTFIANEIRKHFHNDNKVTWIIDRNVNITNVCIARCKFCNFHRLVNQEGTYITTIEEYKQKIEEMLLLGGNQLLLQGGLHPKLGLEYYSTLFSNLKSLYPTVKLHVLGPAEIHHIARIEKTNYKDVLEQLTKAGLDTLPGAGAEVLSDRVRKALSPGKCNSEEWLNVMREAHKLNITTSATMMFGHIETLEERLQHLISIRQVQSEKPIDSQGFATFVPWPFQEEHTVLKDSLGITNNVSSEDYIRFIALSRLMLPNFKNIQASWLTVGVPVGQICLHSGANDFGSIMIEENVVSIAGASHQMNATGMINAIKSAGFTPQLRNQKYEYVY